MTKDATLYQQLQTALTQWVDLTEPQWHKLASIFQVRPVQPQAHLLLPEEKAYELLFVCHGLLRFYYLAEDGTESNKAFIAENMFTGPLAACGIELPVIYGIQALEPTTLLVAKYADFVALFDQYPVFERLGRKLAEWFLRRKELRARSFLQQQAKERYLDFMRQHPDLMQRLPQYHIASYLGITEVSLSRLKRTLA